MNQFKALVALFFLCSVTCGTAFSQQTYSTPGTYQWTVPPCVTSITVKVWGAGGGGGGAASNQNQADDEACSEGGGGGGGGFASRTYTVTPGDIYTVVVGAGGAGGAGGTSNATANNGQAGGASTFSGPATTIFGTLTGNGGGGGGGAWSRNTSNGFTTHLGSDGAGGTGGTGANGTVSYTGGNGSSGRHSGSCYDASGAGGGGAGSAANGTDATAPNSCTLRTGGTGGTPDGGTGADGQILTSYTAARQYKNGNPGSSIGGGGSGAMIHLHNWPNTWTTATGGRGGDGQVIIEYSTSGAVPNQPSPIAGNTTIPCGGGTEAYSVTNDLGVTYTWVYSGTGTITSGQGTSSITLTTTTGGTLTVTPSNSCGDGTPQTLAISISSVSVGLTKTDPTCAGGQYDGSVTLNITGGTAPYIITVDTGATPITQTVPINPSPYTISNLGGMTVQVSVQDANNCTSSATTTLVTPNCCSLSASVTTTQPSCGASNGSINVTPSPSGSYSFSWSDGPSSQNRTNIAAGSYTVTITDLANTTCLFDTTIVLTSNSAVSVSLTKTDPTCVGGQYDGSVTLNITGGTAPYIITVDTGATPITQTVPINPSPYTISNLGGMTVQVSVQDANNCTSSATTTLVTPNCCSLSASVTTTQPNCGASNGSINVTPSPSGSYSFSWSDGPSSQNRTNIAAGSYTVTITDLANTTCLFDTTIVLTSNSAVSVALTKTDPTCAGGQYDGSVTLNITGGTAPYTITGDTGATPITQTVPINPSPYTISNLGGMTVQVSVQDANNCTSSATTTLVTPNCCSLSASVTTTQPSCGASNGSINVTPSPSGSYSFSWSDGPSSQNRTNIAAGSYTVTITDLANTTCLFDTTIVLINPNAPAINNISKSDETCLGNTDGSATVSVSGGTAPYSYLWNNSQTSDTATNLAGGSYSVTVTDAAGCQTIGNISVNAGPSCCTLTTTVNVSTGGGEIPLDCNQGSGTITVNIVNAGTPPYAYSINGINFQTSNIFTGITAGNYTVVTQDADSCLSIASATVSASISNFVLPTAFSPNGDGVNDIYRPLPACVNTNVFRIYNRWGEKVYEASGINIGWDGQYKDKPQPVEVYVYYIEVRFDDGSIEKRTGNLTLLR